MSDPSSVQDIFLNGKLRLNQRRQLIKNEAFKDLINRIQFNVDVWPSFLIIIKLKNVFLLTSKTKLMLSLQKYPDDYSYLDLIIC